MLSISTHARWIGLQMGIMVVKGGVVLALLVAPAFALQFPAGVRRTSTVAFNDAVPTGAG